MIMSIKRRSRWVWLFIAQAKIFCSLFLQDLSIKYKYLRRTREMETVFSELLLSLF